MNHKIYEVLKDIRNRYVEFVLCLKEYFASGKLNGSAKKNYLEGKILVITHSIEKGMGLRETKKGYGKKKAIKLLNFLDDYINKGYNISCFPIFEAIRVLEEYVEYQHSSKVEIDRIEHKFNLLIERLSVEQQVSIHKLVAGYENFTKQQMPKEGQYNFEDFLKLRHSVRDFQYEIVDEDIVRKAVELANMSPSACNRQPVKVYCNTTLEQAKEVDELITGTSGFKNIIPNFAIITVDRAYFTGPEQFQWYINGGIYVAYLSLAFHSLGIGSCIMQWFAFYKTQKKLKEYFDISKAEAIIAVLGFGNYADEFKCICAQRKSVSDTLRMKK